ncbi:MAG: SCO family protein, partial [Armatimonadetes bacterium]|nr:SCO family protein [Armatimonadota bacterium]
SKSAPKPGSGQQAFKAPSSRDIRVDQELNDSVPLNLVFTDSEGRTVELRKYFTDRPVILMPVFYTCAGLCPIMLNNMVDSLHGFKKDSVGKEFEVVTFTIKHTETVAQAKARKDMILDIYARRGAEDGWHFLTGDRESIERLTDAVGFRYVYDETTDSVSHPAAAIVLTPQGQISRYFLDDSYPQQMLLDALKEAGKGRIGVRVESTSFWNCIRIDPITGQRSLNVLKAVKIGAVLTLVLLAVLIAGMGWKHRRVALSAQDAEGGHEGG